MKTLILWDIDGTLTLSGGAGMTALQAALKLEFGIERSLADIDYAGRTDSFIIKQILTKLSLADDDVNIRRFLEAYLRELPVALKNPGTRILPGISAILAALSGRSDCAQALLTGNVERGARIKLGHHGISHFFAFGAFADDSETRNDLGPVALRRAKDHHGVDFAPGRTFVIGDTPHDIACGKVIGAQTIAVATGQYSLEQLRAHQPTAAFADLSDTVAFLEMVGR